MDEAWERAVEAALEGELDPRALTLDGAVKCLGGRLPPRNLLERFQSLEHLSIANVGVASLDQFPRLPRLLRLSLSDNRIAGGLEYLVAAGLDSLRDLDLSNNRIQSLDDLAPLARLRLVSLDLYECPVTRIEDYRSRVFSMIRSLKYLDKMDADENERPETDEEDDEEDEDEEEENEDEDDPGCGEIDGEDHRFKKIAANGSAANVGGGSSTAPVDLDDDQDSDADDDGRVEANGSNRMPNGSNGFWVAAVGQDMDGEDGEDDEEVEDEEDDVEDLVEEIDEEEGEDDDVVEVHEIDDSYEDEEEVDDDVDVDVEGDDEFEEDVEDEEEGDPGGCAGTNQSGDGEIDGHEQGEGDEDENGEIGEEDVHGLHIDRDLEEDDEEEDLGTEYLVQPIAQHEDDEEGSDFDAGEEDDGDEEDGVDDEEEVGPSTSSSPNKRKRGEGGFDDNTDLEDPRPPKQR